MSGRQTEFLVVGGLVLGTIALGFWQMRSPKAAEQAADQAVKRGEIREAKRAAESCEQEDGGMLERNERLSCLARLAELEDSLGQAFVARDRIDAALAEADQAGSEVTSNVRSRLRSASSLVWLSDDRARAIADGRAALALATDLRHRALANVRLGAALTPKDEAEEPLRAARAQILELEGPAAANYALAGSQLGDFLIRRNPREALSVLESVDAIYASIGDGGHPHRGVALGKLGMARVANRDEAGAEAAIRLGLSMTRPAYGVASPHVTVQLCDLGHLLFEAGRDEEAAQFLDEAVDAGLPSGPGWNQCGSEYGGVLHRLGRTAEAREYLHQTLAALEAAGDPNVEPVRKMLAWVESEEAGP